MTTQELADQMKVIFDVMASDEFVDSVANFLWKLYSKLKDKGFTDEQAIQIVSNFNQKSK